MAREQSLRQLAYDHIREMIYRRQFAFDTFYSETKLARQLGLMHMPVHDALDRLDYERYVDRLPGRGFRLHEPTEADVLEARKMRGMIEAHSLKALSREADTPAARTALDEMERALARQQFMLDSPAAPDAVQFWLEDQAFHRATVHFLRLPVLEAQFESFMHLFMPVRMDQNDALDRTRNVMPQHRALIDALRAGDEARALEVLHTHLECAERRTLEWQREG